MPGAWRTMRLGDVVSAILDFRGRTPKKLGMDWGDGEIPALSAVNVRDGHVDLTRTSHFGSAALYDRWMTQGDAAAGDIVITTEAPLGNIAQIPDDRKYILSQRVILLKPDPELVDATFLAYQMRSGAFQAMLDDNRSGTTATGIRQSRLVEIPVTFPPLAEQRQIVAQLESRRAQMNRAREALNAAPPLLEKLRQSILAAAFRGEFTKDWRAKHRDVEPASKLLERIHAERRRNWEQAELAKLKAKVARAGDDTWKAKYPRPRAAETDGLPRLAAGWCWASVAELLAEPLANGRSVQTEDMGFPVLRLTALRNGRIDLRQRKGGAWSAKDAAPFLVRKGDFFVSRGNGSLGLVGRGGFVDDEPDPVAYPDTLIRMRINDALDRTYLGVVWDSPLVRRQIERAAKTTAGIFKVSQSDVAGVAIPLPSRQEQALIAALASTALERVRKLEGIAAAEVLRIASMDAALLASAFRGELIAGGSDPGGTLLQRQRCAEAVAGAPSGEPGALLEAD